jgi:putative flippase GtrA
VLNASYWLISVLLTRKLQLVPVLASSMAYAITATAAFGVHRYFTFRSRNEMRAEAWRFMLTNAAGQSLAAAIPAVLPAAPSVAFALVCVIAPLANFLVYRTVVFRVRKLPNSAS